MGADCAFSSLETGGHESGACERRASLAETKGSRQYLTPGGKKRGKRNALGFTYYGKQHGGPDKRSTVFTIDIGFFIKMIW